MVFMSREAFSAVTEANTRSEKRPEFLKGILVAYIDALMPIN